MVLTIVSPEIRVINLGHLIVVIVVHIKYHGVLISKIFVEHPAGEPDHVEAETLKEEMDRVERGQATTQQIVVKFASPIMLRHCVENVLKVILRVVQRRNEKVKNL
tara:strand:- start:201 stop:518 length:318 start_codon:yes stop_codon:yes gene_type:complete